MDDGPRPLYELRELTPRECRLLLASHHLGRVAIPGPDAPIVLPVCYALDTGTDAVVFQTGAGTKLGAALAGLVVSFQVDDADALYHRGWSVLVTGRASPVTEPAEVARLERLPVRRWVPEGPARWIRVPLTHVAGRRIAPRGSPHGPGGVSGDRASGDLEPGGPDPPDHA